MRSKARIVELLADDYDRSRHSTNIIACFEFGESSYSIHFGSLKEPFCSHNYRIIDHTAYELNWTVESLCYLMAGNLDGRVDVPSKYGLLGKTTVLLPSLQVSLGRTAGADGSPYKSTVELILRRCSRGTRNLVEVILCSEHGMVAGRLNLDQVTSLVDALVFEVNRIESRISDAEIL